MLGEVRDPGLYYLRQPRTLLEMLSEAGGLTPEAGTTVHVRRRRPSKAGPADLETIEIDIAKLLEGRYEGPGLSLVDHDTIYVARAGVVFVEGSVKKPGAYPLHGAATLLKAVTLAGGLDFSARKSSVQVIRASGSGPEVIRVDFADIRRNPMADIRVYDGDIIVVNSSPFKAVLAGFWHGVTRLVNVSKGL